MESGDDPKASRNGTGSDEWSASWLHFRVERPARGYCRVTFDHPPVNTITATTVAELGELVELIEHDHDLNVVVFDSANPEFYLAHCELGHDRARASGRHVVSSPMHGWLDVLVRLSRAPVVSVAAIRGRVRGGGSDFVLACDLRFASRENTLIGQFEVATGVVPGGGAIARLSRLVGRGRALEILLVGDDLDGPRAEQYGYVNRTVADAELDPVVDTLARRLARFDRDIVARIKACVDQLTLPSEPELRSAFADQWDSMNGPAQRERYARLEALGFGTDSDLERRLGERVLEGLGTAGPDLGAET